MRNVPAHVDVLTREMLAASLSGLSGPDLDSLTVHTQRELNERVGHELSRGLTDAQLREFDTLLDDGAGDQRCERWLAHHLPDHRAAVATVRTQLVAEVVEAVAAADPTTVEVDRGIGATGMNQPRQQHLCHYPLQVVRSPQPSGSATPMPEPRCRCSARPVRIHQPPVLGKREREAFLTWLFHDSKREAAERMYITERTLSTHIERIRAKYDALGRPAQTKAALLARAIQDGLVDVDDL